MKKVYIVTKNNHKLRNLKRVLEKYNIQVLQIPEETFEIQSDSCEDIAGCSAKLAAEKYKKPIVKGDFGFFVECLNGLPGPFVKYFVLKIGVKKFLELIKDEDNRNAYMIYSLAYCEPGKKPKVFSVKRKGIISKNLNSSAKWLTDSFIPEGHEMSLGEYRDRDMEKKISFFGDVEKKFAKWYVKNHK